MSENLFPHPLRLAVGSHPAGSGMGCAMNVISYENGDTTISDYPACSDRLLAAMVQQINDGLCTHRDGLLLCPECSLKVLSLGHATVGTTGHDLTQDEVTLVHVRVAAFAARQVLHLVGVDDRAVCEKAIAAAEAYAADPCIENARAAADAADAAADAANAAYAAVNAAYTAANAAYTAANAAHAAANAAHTANTVNTAVNAAANAAARAAHAAARAGLDKVALAHKIIKEFKRLTGLADVETPPETTRQAVARMLVKATP